MAGSVARPAVTVARGGLELMEVFPAAARRPLAATKAAEATGAVGSVVAVAAVVAMVAVVMEATETAVESEEPLA